MVFIRLVSAIEALSKDVVLNRRDDALEERAITDLIAQSSLPREQKRSQKHIQRQEITEEIRSVPRTALQWILQGR